MTPSRRVPGATSAATPFEDFARARTIGVSGDSSARRSTVELAGGAFIKFGNCLAKIAKAKCRGQGEIKEAFEAVASY
jgi:hypothetical protein